MDNTNPKVTLRLKIRMNIVCENSSSYIKLFPNHEIGLEFKYKDRTVSGNIKDNCSLLKVYHCKQCKLATKRFSAIFASLQ